MREDLPVILCEISSISSSVKIFEVPWTPRKICFACWEKEGVGVGRKCRLLLTWTSVGGRIWICSSSLPGRIMALSSSLGWHKLVAITTTVSSTSLSGEEGWRMPSISISKVLKIRSMAWWEVRCPSLLRFLAGAPEEERPAGEIPSMTSILSKRRKHGAMARAVRYEAETRKGRDLQQIISRVVFPIHRPPVVSWVRRKSEEEGFALWIISAHDTERNLNSCLVSKAMRVAMAVFPHPLGPYKSTPDRSSGKSGEEKAYLGKASCEGPWDSLGVV